jgi:flagellar motor switch protein FliN
VSAFLDCWIPVATALFSQALTGEPTFEESLPKPMAGGSFGFAYTLAGEDEGRFLVVLDGSLLEASLVGEGVDQKAGWAELLREVADAAAGDLLAKKGRKCQVASVEEIAGASQISRAFQLKSAAAAWTILVRDEVRPKPEAKPEPRPEARPGAKPESAPVREGRAGREEPVLVPSLELLLDVELEAALRFGSRELPLSEILDLGAGDVVELDRNVSDPVDLIVGDKIVARGEVVLVNGSFGLRVTEVASPRKRLESIRCLF